MTETTCLDNAYISDKASEYAHKYRRDHFDLKGEVSNDIYQAFYTGAKWAMQEIERILNDGEE